jgi:hypothetical protein
MAFRLAATGANNAWTCDTGAGGTRSVFAISIERLARSYLTRFQVDSAVIPVDVAGLMYLSSSPVSDTIERF